MYEAIRANPVGLDSWEDYDSIVHTLHPDADVRDPVHDPDNREFNNATQGAQVLGYLCDFARKHCRGGSWDEIVADFLTNTRHAVDMLGSASDDPEDRTDWETIMDRVDRDYVAELRGEP